MAQKEPEVTSPVENSEAAQSTKRKADLEELEVDVSAPEPPSKRAKRALKKGKALPAKVSSDDEKEQDGEDKSKAEKTRSEHSVWIGNLPFTVTPQELRQWLVDNSGGVLTDESITRIKLPTSKTPGKPKEEKPANKGFAYVDFTDIGGKVAAIALSETQLGYRRLLIKDATSFEGRPAKEKDAAAEGDAKENGAKSGQGKQQDNDKDSKASRKVFVGNLSFQVKEDDVWKNFEKCGEIESVKLATFEDTGKCKGYGWIKFKDADAAAWAVKGFVKIKEQVETEADFEDNDDAADKEKQQQQQRQTKTRKWWINRMFGRELKLELAEDDQARYKKRFGKDRGAARNGPSRGPPRSGGNWKRDQNDDRNGQAITEESNTPAEKPAQPKTAKEMEIARLTGKVVESTGTKVNFD